MGLANRSQWMRRFAPRDHCCNSAHPLQCSAISPARAQAEAQAPDPHDPDPRRSATRPRCFAGRGKARRLIETLRSIVKVSPVAPAQAHPRSRPSRSRGGFGADVLSEASSKIGELSAEFEQSVRADDEVPLALAVANQYGERSWGAAAPARPPLARRARRAPRTLWRNASRNLRCVGLWPLWTRARRMKSARPGPVTQIDADTLACTSAA